MLRPILFALLFFSTTIYAMPSSNPRHMFSLGSTGTNLFGSSLKTEPTEESVFQSYEAVLGEFNVNYAYRVTPRFQMGVFAHSKVNSNSFVLKNYEQIITD